MIDNYVIMREEDKSDLLMMTTGEERVWPGVEQRSAAEKNRLSVSRNFVLRDIQYVKCFNQWRDIY